MVDNVSGATFTSNAIKNAVKNALTEAGVDVGTLAAAPEKAKDQQIADEASVAAPFTGVRLMEFPARRTM